MTSAELLKQIAEIAPALRRAGVLKVDTDELYLELAPFEEVPPPATASEKASEPNALDDPETFGGRKPPALDFAPDNQEDQGGEFDEHGRPVTDDQE